MLQTGQKVAKIQKLKQLKNIRIETHLIEKRQTMAEQGKRGTIEYTELNQTIRKGNAQTKYR